MLINLTFKKPFFYNQVSYNHSVKSSNEGDFFVDDKYHFAVNEQQTEEGTGLFKATDMIEVGYGYEIPLWIFGFLY
jgi:uncharacterized protein